MMLENTFEKLRQLVAVKLFVLIKKFAGFSSRFSRGVENIGCSVDSRKNVGGKCQGGNSLFSRELLTVL